MQEQNTSLLKFPCDFTFKVIGEASDDFEGAVLGIFRSHFTNLGEAAIKITPSKNKKYLSLSIHVFAQNKEQLDKTYQALTENPLILFVL